MIAAVQRVAAFIICGRLLRKPLEYYLEKSSREKKQAYMPINLLKGRVDRLHRLVWMNANGEIPVGYELDHINGRKWDNRLPNLRLISHSDHARNHNPVGRKYAKRSPEFCQLMSNLSSERCSKPEYREKIRLALIGKKASETTRKKMSESQLRRYRNDRSGSKGL